MECYLYYSCYADETDKYIKDMQNESGLSRPEAAWYAKEYDADYFRVSGISVKRWMNLPPRERALAGKIE